MDKGLPGYAAIYCSIYLFYDIYCIFNKYLPYHLEVEVTKRKNRVWLFGMAGEGGFMLDVFWGLFFDVFLAKTELQPQ